MRSLQVDHCDVALAPATTGQCAQTALNLIRTDPALDVDGEYGPLTMEAVKRFQESHRLVADGWAGDVTHAAFQAEVAGMR
jgi:peptidoglycan hydrolase-like protein with peptidoglycan-binding domain